MLAWLPSVMDVTNAALLTSPWKLQGICGCLSEPEHDGVSVVQNRAPVAGSMVLGKAVESV